MSDFSPIRALAFAVEIGAYDPSSLMNAGTIDLSQFGAPNSVAVSRGWSPWPSRPG